MVIYTRGGRRVFRVRWGRIEEIKKPSSSSYKRPNRIRNSRTQRRKGAQASDALHAALASRHYFKSRLVRDGFALLLREKLEEGPYLGCWECYLSKPVCPDCKERREKITKHLDFMFEELLLKLWQRECRERLAIKREWTPSTWRQRRDKFRTKWEKFRPILGEPLHLDTDEMIENCVKRAWVSYQKEVLLPLWRTTLARQHITFLRQRRLLIEQLLSALARLLGEGAQTALALRERKLLCTSRGGLANEQHIFSLLAARLSLIEKQPGKGLFSVVSTNLGGGHDAALSAS